MTTWGCVALVVAAESACAVSTGSGYARAFPYSVSARRPVGRL
ncbi:hypothetical protein ACF1G4_27270 [Streptomyces caelestis]